SSAPAPYRATPNPPTSVSTPSDARTTVGSTCQRSAHPPATPAIRRSRLRGTRGRWCVPVTPKSSHTTRRRASGTSPEPSGQIRGTSPMSAAAAISTVVRVQPGSPLLSPPDPPAAEGEAPASSSDADWLAEHRVIGGVCALLAERFGIDVVWIRLGFVV